MYAFRNFSVCVALVSMVAFSMTGCCSGGCGLFSGKGQAVSQGISSAPCETCGGGASYSTPTQSYSTPTQSFATPTASYSQGYSPQEFPSSVPTSAGSGSVNLPSVQSFGGSGSVNLPSAQGFGGGQSLPSLGGGSGSR